MKKIGVLTSGGDSPGMNACIRAVVRSALYSGYQAVGIFRGYEGLINNEMQVLTAASVGNIIQRGGTILKTARSEAFRTTEGRARAYQNLVAQDLYALVVIGGDGTYAGAAQFCREYPDIQIIGAPGTIDNDLFGTDYTIGFDTAINTAMQAIDRLRDTADATNRLFVVEVMGRDAGWIALQVGLSSGAEAVLVPETPTDLDAVIQTLERGWQRHKTSCIIVVAEGDDAGGAFKVAQELKNRFQRYELKVSILGHIQRGGSPTCFDRVLASRLGADAVSCIQSGLSGLAVGIQDNKIVRVNFDLTTKHKSPINPNLLHLVEVLSF